MGCGRAWDTRFVGRNTHCGCNENDCPVAVVGLVHRFCVFIPCVCSCVFVVCGRMCVDRLSPCPDPGLCLGCNTFRRDGEIRVPCEGHLAACCRVSALLQCSPARFTTVQLCTSVPLFLIFFWCVKTALACQCASSHWHLKISCVRGSRVFGYLSVGTLVADLRV